MRIGILTFHCAHNFGAVLQAYALQEYLLKVGYNVYIIDYKPDYLVDSYKIFGNFPSGFKSIKALLGECMRLPRRIKRYTAFASFTDKYMRKLKLNLHATNQIIDIFIFGSDQIWNKEISHGRYDPIFLGNFEAARGKRKIAYSASSGHKLMNDKELDSLCRYLRKFTAVGVREESLHDLLIPHVPCDVCIVLDPTILVDRDVFEKILRKPKVSKKYILVYQAYLVRNGKGSRDIIEIAEHLAKQIDGIVIDLSFYLTFYKKKYSKVVSPEEFLGYVKYAECVVTNSFHGTAFSIIFEKSFYTIKVNKKVDMRALSLLDSLDLAPRMIDKEIRPVLTTVDYLKSNENLMLLRDCSRKFLDSVLPNLKKECHESK